MPPDDPLLSQVTALSASARALVDQVHRLRCDRAAVACRTDLELLAWIVCDNYGVHFAEIRCRRRPQRLVEPRHVAAFIAIESLGLATTQVARWIGRKDHSSASYAHRKVSERQEQDSRFRRRLEAITATLDIALAARIKAASK